MIDIKKNNYMFLQGVIAEETNKTNVGKIDFGQKDEKHLQF